MCSNLKELFCGPTITERMSNWVGIMMLNLKMYASAAMIVLRIFVLFTVSVGCSRKLSLRVRTSTTTSVPSFSATMSSSSFPARQFRCLILYPLPDKYSTAFSLSSHRRFSSKK